MFIKSINLYCKHYVNKIILRNSESSAHTNTQILCDIFGMSSREAESYIKRNKLNFKESGMLLDSINCSRKLGYKDEEILDNPNLLTKHHLEVKQHYLALEEGGFVNISARTLAKSRTYMRRAVTHLKEIKLIPKEVNVQNSFLKYLEPEQFKFPLEPCHEESKWNEIHRTILQEYLKWRLQATQEEIIKIFRIHRMVKNKSFRIIKENIKIAEDLGFEPRRILKCAYLLHNYPDYPKAVLQDFPYLLGVDMRKEMRNYPKLVMVSPNKIAKTYGILKEFNIPDETIKNTIHVFQMSPETVRLRLEEIQRTPELKVLLQHPRILSLVVHHTRTKSRLSFLQQLQLKCASLTVLGSTSNDSFESYLKEGQDVNSPKDVMILLKHIFQVSEKEIRKHWKQHPFYLHVPLMNMEETFEYLKQEKFHRSSILKVMHIILYPKEKVEKALKEINSNKEISKKLLSQARKLNLALYYMEKEHHFTGNGIWKKCDTQTTPEKTLE